MPREQSDLLTVITVNYKSANLINKLVSEVAPLPVVVINNDEGDTRALALIAAKTPGRVVVMQAGSNLGFGTGMNLGLTHCETPYAALLNPDVTISAGQIQELLDVAVREQASVVSPRLVDNNGAVARTAFTSHLSLGTLLVDAICALIPSPMLHLLLRELAGANRAFGPAGRVQALNGAVWVAQVLSLRAVGGFDERFFLYGEESELCERLGQANYTLWFEPSVQVRHTGGASSGGRRQTSRRLASTVLTFELRGQKLTARVVRTAGRFTRALRRAL